MSQAHSVAISHYDLPLLALAIFVCALASFTLLRMLDQACKVAGYLREIWLWTGAVAGGFGIWAMHFIAMLAYNPGIRAGYNLGLTVLPLFGAILLTGVGLSVSVGGSRWARLIGGSIVGAGAAATQCVGMFAYEVAGESIGARPTLSFPDCFARLWARSRSRPGRAAGLSSPEASEQRFWRWRSARITSSR